MDSLEMIATLHRSSDQLIYKAKVRLNSFLFSVICSHVEAVDWPSDYTSNFRFGSPGSSLYPWLLSWKKNCSTLSLFTHSTGRTNNYPLKGGGGRVGTLLTEGLKKSPVPSHPSYWLKLTFYLAVICFNYKGMVPIHNIHLINQYYSNMFAVFIV